MAPRAPGHVTKSELAAETYEAVLLGAPLAQQPVLPWAGLRSRFLDALPPADQFRVFDLTARTARQLHRWAARYPLIRRVRVWPLALSVAAAAPFSSVDALITMARWNLWAFTLDDLFDEERVPERDLMRRAERYRTLVYSDDGPPTGDSLATALCDIRDELARCPLFAVLRTEWATAVCGTIDGMAREYGWRQHYRREGPSALPSYLEYLATGRFSIGGPPHVWVAMVTINDPSTAEHIEHLRAMERLASISIRLANDLQSYHKEIQEGKINALGLLGRGLLETGHDATDVYQQAEAKVRDQIVDGLASLDNLQNSARCLTRQPEAAIANLARFVCDFYLDHDYHTFTAQRG